MKLGPYLLGPNDSKEQGIYLGDAKILAEEIPDESVDLIFTDPEYQNLDDYRWLAMIAARILKEGGSLVAFCAHHLQINCGSILSEYLDECPILEHRILGPRGRLFPWHLICNMLPALWVSKGQPKTNWMALQMDAPLKSARGHKWGKNEEIAKYRISRMADVDDVVLDPFVGGGTTSAICKMLGRYYLAFEIIPEATEQARGRVRAVQPVMFLPGSEQLRIIKKEKE